MEDEDDLYDDGLPDEPQGDSDWAKARRAVKAEREAKAQEKARADQAERVLAFARAGIPLADQRSEYFMAGYKGETTPEAIQAAWAEVFGGATGQPGAPAGEGQPQGQPQGAPDGLPPTAAELAAQQMQADLAAQARVAAAGAGAVPVPADAVGSVIDSFSKGGTEGMLSTLQGLGIPIADDGILR